MHVLTVHNWYRDKEVDDFLETAVRLLCAGVHAIDLHVEYLVWNSVAYTLHVHVCIFF